VSAKRSASAIGDLAGILGGPVTPPPPTPQTTPAPQSPRAILAVPTPPPHAVQQRLIDDEDNVERSDRITAILPISLLSQVEARIAVLRRKKKVSVSGYIEAALRELLSTGDRDLEVLEKHHVRARRTLPRIR
jgi:hypothetical protein